MSKARKRVNAAMRLEIFDYFTRPGAPKGQHQLGMGYLATGRFNRDYERVNGTGETPVPRNPDGSPLLERLTSWFLSAIGLGRAAQL